MMEGQCSFTSGRSRDQRRIFPAGGIISSTGAKEIQTTDVLGEMAVNAGGTISHSDRMKQNLSDCIIDRIKNDHEKSDRNRIWFPLFINFIMADPSILTGCSVTQQAEQVYNLVNCDFRIRSVENINLAGINIQNTSDLKNLGMADIGRIMSALTKPTFPLTFRMNIDGQKPESAPAGLNRLDYIVYIDEIQMTSGVLENSVTIPPNNGIITIPIDMNVDLKKILQGKSMDAIVNFGFNRQR